VYEKRIKIFVILMAALLVVCLFRLTQMQLLPNSSLHEEIEELKHQRSLSVRLNTVRGGILDRKGRVLAADEARFQLCISYKLSSFADERLLGLKSPEELEAGREDLQQIIDKCTYFGLECAEIEDKIRKINDSVWNLRLFQAWRKNCSNSELFERYRNNLLAVKRTDFVADFERNFPRSDERLALVSQTNIAEMYEDRPLLELKTDDDVFTAQLEFMNTEGVRILPKIHRSYPYHSVAAQTIGWVGPAQGKMPLADTADELSSYLPGEVSGQRPGVEYVCESILRGRRGEEVYDIDRQLVRRTETQLGEDVTLTLDIELQKRIEEYLAEYEHDAECTGPMSAVVIDVVGGEILAMVSLPSFDLNRIRYDYGDVASDPNQPLLNRAIYELYPPGSVIKPVILIAGLQSGAITADKVISCPARPADDGWPNCHRYN